MNKVLALTSGIGPKVLRCLIAIETHINDDKNPAVAAALYLEVLMASVEVSHGLDALASWLLCPVEQISSRRLHA